MAEVMNVPRQPDGQSYYEQSALKSSSPSSSSLFLPHDDLTPPAEYKERVSPSYSSSLTSSRLPSDSDFSSTRYSTPTSSDDLTLERTLSPEDIQFPDYDSYSLPVAVKESPAESIAAAIDPREETVESVTTSTTRSDSPLHTPTVSDDTAVRQEPSHHVDYLSHDWREEDIWSSWRHIVSHRKVYGQKSRLENASWRTWAKSKYRLRTISPKSLNWLKESDVTWLYGPMKTAESHPLTSTTFEHVSHLSKNNSFINKKPILKKRSVSEVMLQKSLSTSSLLKQAAASVEAQGRGQLSRRSALQRANSDFATSTAPSAPPSRDQIDCFASHSSSGKSTPSEFQEKRHIRFDDTVEQCIAVESKDGEFEDETEGENDGQDAQSSPSDSNSDDGLIIMKRKKRPRKFKDGKDGDRRSRSNSQSDRRMIETLPSVNLKYRTDSPGVTGEVQQQQQHVFGRSWGSGKLSPSPSQETLKPSRPSQNFLLGDDDEDGEADLDSSWSFGASNPRSSLGAALNVGSGDTRGRNGGASSRARAATPAPVDDDYTMEGMRRTESGMFMPYDETEDEILSDTLFGKVNQTINTARDIAHVIWNVGWRK